MKERVKKPNIFIRIGKGFKEIVSELKKVTWPKSKQVASNTGVVVVVVLFFLVTIGLFDFLLSLLLNALTG
ncbi:MAG: preprotein translocase subunit SecE [Christensenellales bacterium]|jgi:preprotein translocase subunit SecE